MILSYKRKPAEHSAAAEPGLIVVTPEEGFEKVDGEFKAVRGELKAGFDRMQWTLFTAAAGIIAALIAAPHL